MFLINKSHVNEKNSDLPGIAIPKVLIGEIFVKATKDESDITGFVTISAEQFRYLKNLSVEERANQGWAGFEQDFLSNDF